MARTRVALVGFAAVAALASLGAHAADLKREAGTGGTPPPASAVSAVLYSQMDNISTNGAPDQDFESLYDAYDSFAADDFVVPAGQTWRITRINTVGSQAAGGTATSVDVVIHADNGINKPGAPLCTYNGLVPTSQTGGSYVLDLPSACVVSACGGGHYWVNIQTNQDALTQDQHFWSNRTTTSNSLSQWKNPGDGFATGCTDWNSQIACGVGGSFPDFLFSIEGTSKTYTKGDFNADSCADLVFRSNVTPTQNKVWFMDGVTRTAESAITPDAASADWVIRGVDDFNADNMNDLVFWNQTTGAVEFWLMNGTARVGAAVPLGGAAPLATNWDLSGTGDFNSDGKPDIVWRNFTSQNIVVWTMNGTNKLGGIIPTPAQAVDFNWKIVAALDYNNDGLTDFLWYNVDSGRIVTWYMNASVVRTTGQFTNPMQAGDNNWRVLGGGDYSRKYVPGTPPVGSNDIVWRNETSGNQVVWHMDNASTRVHGEFTKPGSNTPALDWTIVGPR